MAVGRKQLRGQQRNPTGRVKRRNQSSKPKPVDARQKLRKNNNSIVIKSEFGIRNGVQLYTSHFDARHKIDAKKVSSSKYPAPSRGGIARNALNDVRKNAKPNNNTKKRNLNLNNKHQNTSAKKRKRNNNRAGNRESTFTGKSIQVYTANDLAPKERKTLVKGKSLSVIAKNKISKSNQPYHKTINNSWIGPSQPTPPEVIPSASKKSLPAKVVISNLHPNVTQEDILELFGAIGPLRDGHLNSVGTADVVYRVAEDAFAAYSKYHGRNLDGQPMILKITTAEEEGSSGSMLPSRSNKAGTFSSTTPYYSAPYSNNNTTTTTPVVFTVKL